MFLATTSRKDFWSLEDEILILGPWCVRFDDPAWLKGVRHRMLPNVWDDRERLEKGALYCHDIQADLFEQLAGYLNAQHGTNLSPRYWRILLGAWLLYYCHQLFDRYTQVSEAFGQHPDAVSVALHYDDFHVARTTGEFLPFYHTDHYNLQLYSEIFRFLGKRFPERRAAYVPDDPPRAGGEGAVRRAAGFAGDVLASVSRRAMRVKAEIVTDELYPAGQSSLWRWVAKSRGRSLPLVGKLGDPLKASAVMDERRLGLARLQGKDEFRRLVIATLPRALPAVALEGFAKARHRGPATRGPVPRAVFASTGFYYNDYFKLAAAEWAERGAKVWGLQHGGQYGTAKYSLAESFERTICDRYFTWGWSSTSADSKLADLPIPRLSDQAAKRARKGRGTGAEILLLTVENVRNAHHLFPHPMGWQWQEYFSWMERFIGHLGETTKDLTVRMYPHDYGWGRRARLDNLFPGLRFDRTGLPLAKRVESARLVVTDYPGTPFFELMALDVPSVHFWNEAHWEARSEAVPCFYALRRAGIVHPDPESAARKTRELAADPMPWWTSKPVRAAREELVERYSRIRPNWLATWKDALLARRKAS
ncbi:MAG: hypothetical protein HY078_05810 [Elusimicrobia bacterium]|nr:hypothetical protein [Elusimicrobiota bacterium]